MPKFYHKRTSIRRIDGGHVRFGVRDERGRAIGAIWTVHEIIAEPYEAGSTGACYIVPFDSLAYYQTRVQATRDGMPFGASQGSTYARTLPEAHSKNQTKIEASRKRYIKKHG
jgi:hypothetical protein